MSKKKKNRHKGYCYNCTQPATTRDHLPPKCFFLKPLPTNLITLRACEDCNNQASRDDEYARLFIALNYDTPSSEAGLAFWKQTFESLKTKNPKLLQRVKDTLVIAAVPGATHKFGPAVALEAGPFERVFKRIARGLYYRETGTRLSKNARLEVIRAPWEEIERFSTTRSERIGHMTLKWNFAEDHPEAAVWVFEFFDAERVTVCCLPSDDN